MTKPLLSAVRPALVLLSAFALLLGVAYPLAITGIASVAFPAQAGGSLIRNGNTIIGSSLIGQNFTSAGYFHPRPSAAGNGYDASASAATNLAPGARDLRDAIAGRIADARVQGFAGDGIPADLVTSSASGLDPDLSPEAALTQIARVAQARAVPEAQLRALIAANTAYPLFGIIGESRINVLLLNRQLDKIAPKTNP